MVTIELENFRILGLLGEGSEFQAFLARDLDSSEEVVLKRIHPAIVGRGDHRLMEDNLRRGIALKLDSCNRISNVSKIIGYTQQKNHDVYFGDSLKENYTVLVEERAKGIPLVGAVLDQVKGLPVCLPQNLFVLHPMRNTAKEACLGIILQLLDTAESIWNAGLVPMDFGPHNVFFDPLHKKITLVDEGIIMHSNNSIINRDYLDLHDFYLEIISSYFTSGNPPRSVIGYRKSNGIVVVPDFTKTIDHLINLYSSSDGNMAHMHTVEILRSIGSRTYSRFSEFKDHLVENVNLRMREIEATFDTGDVYTVWQDAIHLFYSSYWGKFLFDPKKDLSDYI